MKLAEEFEKANKRLLDKSADWLSEMNESKDYQNQHMPAAAEMTQLAEDIRVRKQALVEQMRAELGSDRL